MKKLLFLAFFTLANLAHAQFEFTYKAGVGVTYLSPQEQYALQAKTILSMPNQAEGALGLTYSLEEKTTNLIFDVDLQLPLKYFSESYVYALSGCAFQYFVLGV
ncbi:MAG: hypothetical protein C4K58_00975 [Flavobacteriaceae bacterium]|nr:MAG: hypothetical protein C4K58_00975 [Flavobacteriaceae bacterium]